MSTDLDVRRLLQRSAARPLREMNPEDIRSRAQRRMRRRRAIRGAGFTAALVTMMVAAVAILPAGPSSVLIGPSDDHAGSAWWGRTYASRSIIRGNERHSLVAGTKVELAFEQRSEGGVLRWNAGCNTFGAPVTITPRRLDIGEVSQSAKGCPDELDEQDEELRRFFESDPAWDRDDGTLTLSGRGTVIAFEETTDEDRPPLSTFTGVWYGPDGKPAERGDGPNRTFEVAAQQGARHCDWESAVILSVAWPLGATYEIGPDTPPLRQYVRDPQEQLSGFKVPGQLDLDAQLPEGSRYTGYHTGRAELWFGSDGGDRYVYLKTDKGVERWPRVHDELIACA